jgi:hypothetical protein
VALTDLDSLTASTGGTGGATTISRQLPATIADGTLLLIAVTATGTVVPTVTATAAGTITANQSVAGTGFVVWSGSLMLNAADAGTTVTLTLASAAKMSMALILRGDAASVTWVNGSAVNTASTSVVLPAVPGSSVTVNGSEVIGLVGSLYSTSPFTGTNFTAPTTPGTWQKWAQIGTSNTATANVQALAVRQVQTTAAAVSSATITANQAVTYVPMVAVVAPAVTGGTDLSIRPGEPRLSTADGVPLLFDGLDAGIYDVAAAKLRPLSWWGVTGAPAAVQDSADYTWESSGLVGAGFQNTLSASPLNNAASQRPWLVGADIAGLHRSLDRGKTWRPANKGLGSNKIAAILWHPSTAGKAWVLTDGGLYTSTDFGDNWSRTGPDADADANGTYWLGGQEHPRPTGRLLAADDSNLWVATHTNGLRRTGDNGGTWSSEAFANDYVRCIGLDPNNPDVLFVGVSNGGQTGGTGANLGTTSRNGLWKITNARAMSSTVAAAATQIAGWPASPFGAEEFVCVNRGGTTVVVIAAHKGGVLLLEGSTWTDCDPIGGSGGGSGTILTRYGGSSLTASDKNESPVQKIQRLVGTGTNEIGANAIRIYNGDTTQLHRSDSDLAKCRELGVSAHTTILSISSTQYRTFVDEMIAGWQPGDLPLDVVAQTEPEQIVRWGWAAAAPFEARSVASTKVFTRYDAALLQAASNGKAIRVTSGGGLTPGIFYMISVSGQTFQLATTPGGAAVTPNGNPIEYVEPDAAHSGGTFTLAKHGLTNGDQIIVRGGTAGLTANMGYFVVGAAADTFQLAASSGGSPVATTGSAALQWHWIGAGENVFINSVPYSIHGEGFVDPEPLGVAISQRRTFYPVTPGSGRDGATGTFTYGGTSRLIGPGWAIAEMQRIQRAAHDASFAASSRTDLPNTVQEIINVVHVISYYGFAKFQSRIDATRDADGGPGTAIDIMGYDVYRPKPDIKDGMAAWMRICALEADTLGKPYGFYEVGQGHWLTLPTGQQLGTGRKAINYMITESTGEHRAWTTSDSTKRAAMFERALLYARKPFLCGAENGGSANISVITLRRHGLSDGDAVRVPVGPTPLAAGTTYYVRDATTNTFKLAASAGGAAITLTEANQVITLTDTAGANLPDVVGPATCVLLWDDTAGTTGNSHGLIQDYRLSGAYDWPLEAAEFRAASATTGTGGGGGGGTETVTYSTVRPAFGAISAFYDGTSLRIMAGAAANTASTGQLLWYSGDGGATWTCVSTGTGTSLSAKNYGDDTGPNAMISRLTYLYPPYGRQFVVGDVRRDPDDTTGATWLYAGRGGVWSVRRSSTTWLTQPATRGLAVTVNMTVASHPRDASKVVVGNRDYTAFKSSDGGVSFVPLEIRGAATVPGQVGDCIAWDAVPAATGPVAMAISTSPGGSKGVDTKTGVFYSPDIYATTPTWTKLAWNTTPANNTTAYPRGFTGTAVGATNGTFTLAGHGLSNGDVIVPATAPASTTLKALGRGYYVVNATTNTFALSLTAGGAALTLTSAGNMTAVAGGQEITGLGFGRTGAGGTEVFLAAVSYSGLWRREGVGGGWTQITDGMLGIAQNRCRILWVPGTSVVFLHGGNEVWRSDTAGANGSWTKILDSASSDFDRYDSLALSADNQTLFVGVGDGGVKRVTNARTSTGEANSVVQTVTSRPSTCIAVQGGTGTGAGRLFVLLQNGAVRIDSPVTSSTAIDIADDYLLQNQDGVRSMQVAIDGAVFGAGTRHGVMIGKAA